MLRPIVGTSVRGRMSLEEKEQKKDGSDLDSDKSTGGRSHGKWIQYHVMTEGDSTGKDGWGNALKAAYFPKFKIARSFRLFAALGMINQRRARYLPNETVRRQIKGFAPFSRFYRFSYNGRNSKTGILQRRIQP